MWKRNIFLVNRFIHQDVLQSLLQMFLWIHWAALTRNQIYKVLSMASSRLATSMCSFQCTERQMLKRATRRTPTAISAPSSPVSQIWRSKAQQEAALSDFQCWKGPGWAMELEWKARMSCVWCVEIKPRDITTMPSPVRDAKVGWSMLAFLKLQYLLTSKISTSFNG